MKKRILRQFGFLLLILALCFTACGQSGADSKKEGKSLADEYIYQYVEEQVDDAA